jgi:O-antigen/teichoic acid export membrane protein
LDSESEQHAPKHTLRQRLSVLSAGWPGGFDYRLGFRLAGPAGAAIVARGGQVLLAFVMARALGVAGYGEFVFAVGAAVLAGILADFGWPNVVNRELPVLIRRRSWNQLRGLNRAATICVTVFALTCAVAMLVAAQYFSQFALGLRMGALLAVPMALVLLRQQQLPAVDRATAGLLLDQGMAATAVLLVHLAHPLDTEAALGVYAAALALEVIVGSWIYASRLPAEARIAAPQYRAREWLGSGWAMFSSMLPRMLITRFDVLMVAPLAGLYQAGLFGSALRLTLLMTFPQYILQTLVTPRFSRAFADHDLGRVRRLLLLSSLFAFATAVPFLAPIVAAPGFVMAKFFGSEFAVGGATLFWLGIGQFIAAFGIPLNAMIAMGGNHKAMGRQGIVILVATFVGGFFLISRFGATGAGVLTMLSNSALTLGMVWLALPILRRNPGHEGGYQAGSTPRVSGGDG